MTFRPVRVAANYALTRSRIRELTRKHAICTPLRLVSKFDKNACRLLYYWDIICYTIKSHIFYGCIFYDNRRFLLHHLHCIVARKYRVRGKAFEVGWTEHISATCLFLDTYSQQSGSSRKATCKATRSPVRFIRAIQIDPGASYWRLLGSDFYREAKPSGSSNKDFVRKVLWSILQLPKYSCIQPRQPVVQRRSLLARVEQKFDED